MRGTGKEKKNPAFAVWNSSFELVIETGGTQSVAYDFQSRPVGHQRSQGSVFSSLRSRELVSNHEQGRVNSKNSADFRSDAETMPQRKFFLKEKPSNRENFSVPK
jgi:hypothetical protein